MICNGWGMGETHLGAYAEKARVKGDWLVRLPDGMTTRDAMAIGTAGYTAMLSVLALEKHGLTPSRWSGRRHRCGRRRRLGGDCAVLSKLGSSRHRLDWPGMAEAALPQGRSALSEVIDRSRVVRCGQAAGKRALGRAALTAWDRRRSPICCR